jgi:hypothetical protein
VRRVLTLVALLLLAGCATAPGGEEKPGGGRWQPRPGTAWQWQLSGRLDTSVDVPVYDIDGFDHTKATVTELHREGRTVICYQTLAQCFTLQGGGVGHPRPGGP